MQYPRFLLLLATASLAAQGNGTSATQEPAVDPITLHAVNTVPYSDTDWNAWKGSPLCDSSGNVYIMPVSPVDPRDVRARQKDPRSKARYTKKPGDIVRVGTDGKKTVFRPSTLPAASAAAETTVGTFTIDPGGTLHAEVWAAAREVTETKRGNLYIASFKDDGSYASHVEISQEEVIVGRFEFFGTGAILVDGHRPYEGRRVVIMSPGGDSFRDVSPLPGASDPPRLDHMVRGGDGRIYFLPPGKESVYVMDTSGASEPAFALAPMPREYALNDMKPSGPRLALMYQETTEDKPRFWIAVYNATIGERLALYQEEIGPPICYRYEDGRDLFTAIKGKNLVTLSPE